MRDNKNNLNAGLKLSVTDTTGSVILAKIPCYLGSSKPTEGPHSINKPANKSKIHNIRKDMVILDQAEHEHKFSQNLSEPIASGRSNGRSSVKTDQKLNITDQKSH